ncbi:MAG: hypothetical protein ACE5F7_00995 [Nitrospiria bacterium]
MDLEYLGVLEQRVQDVIELLRETRREKQNLELELAEQKQAFQQLQQERGEVRQRVEHILGKLNDLNQGSEAELVNQGAEAGGEQETSY